MLPQFMRFGGSQGGRGMALDPQEGRLGDCRSLSQTGGFPGCSPQPFNLGDPGQKPGLSFLVSLSPSCGPD